MTQEIVLKNPTSLHEHPRNQEFFDDITGSKWEEFKTSIAQMGVMNPLIVTGDRCFAYARRVFENDILRTIIRSDLEIHAVKNAIACCERGALQLEALIDLLIAL